MCRNATNGANRLVLGTAQLGMPYGIANRQGKPTQANAERIVAEAWEGGVTTFDTAQAYGDSEQVLGHAFSALRISSQVKVISKLAPDFFASGNKDLESAVETSLHHLGVPKLGCLMLHNEDHLPLLNGRLGEIIQEGKASGLFQEFGVSVYTTENALSALSHPLVSAVQIPASIFDRRFEQAGIFQVAEKLGKTLFIRSAMLQGVLCMQPSMLPPFLSPLKTMLERYYQLCKRNNIQQGPMALAWLITRFPDVLVLFGAESCEQVRSNLDMCNENREFFTALAAEIEEICPPQDPTFLNPGNWETL